MAEELVDNVERSRYEYRVDGGMGIVDYRRKNGTIALLHTEVPPELGGRGIATRMVRAVLDILRAKGDRIVSHCTFVDAFIRANPEFQDLVLK